MKLLSSSLAGLIFVTNGVLAHALETNMWADRKKNIQMASLPASVPALPPVSKPLPNQLSKNKISKWVGEKEVDQKLKDLIQTLSGPYGTIRSVKPSTESDSIVVHIQDVHMNTEAQDNIAAALNALFSKEQIDMVALEGAFDEIDISEFRNFPDKSKLKKASDVLLADHDIAGPLHSLLNFENQIPRIMGVDDEKHYEANVQAVRESYPLKEELKKSELELDIDIELEKKNVFSKELLGFDQVVRSYRKGELSMGDYADHLSHYSDDLPLRFSSFLEAVRLERALDFKKVEAERSFLLSSLLKELKDQDKADLISASLSFRSKEINHADFYHYLQSLCLKNNISLEAYPNMNDYLQYVLLSDSIDAERVLVDFQNVEQDIYNKLASTDSQRELIQESRTHYLKGKLIDFGLTKQEWKEIEKGNPDLRSFEDFYLQAEHRDVAMASNITKNLNDGDVSVLVSGGFHSDGIHEIL